jgi:hypothetical protein
VVHPLHIFYLLDALDREISASLKNGVAKTLLSGGAGAVTGKLKNEMYNFSISHLQLCKFLTVA